MDTLSHFRSIEELVWVLYKENKLLTEMFNKRRLYNFGHDIALSLVDDNEGRLKRLLDYGVLTQTGNTIQIETDYLNFFEEVLNVNEEISVLSVQECINTLKENICYYLQENNEHRKLGYQDSVRQILKKTGFRTIKNVIDLKRNMDVAYKQEQNYANKKTRLKNLDEKSHSIRSMIKECEKLLDTENAFFLMATDPHMAKTISDVRYCFVEAYHSLMEIDKQIIAYLNQVEQQNRLFKKIRRLKYLQDQFTINEETNLLQVLDMKNPIWMMSRSYLHTRVSLDLLKENEQFLALLRKVAQNKGIEAATRSGSEPLLEEDLVEHVADVDIVNPNEVWNAFAASSYDLFEFIRNYDFRRELTIEENTTLFCQIVINHFDECRITNKYITYKDIVYPLVYAK